MRHGMDGRELLKSSVATDALLAAGRDMKGRAEGQGTTDVAEFERLGDREHS